MKNHRIIWLLVAFPVLMTACQTIGGRHMEYSKIFVSSLKDKARRSSILVFKKTFDPQDSVILGYNEIRKELDTHKISVDLLPDNVKKALDDKKTKAIVISRMYDIGEVGDAMPKSLLGDNTTRILILWDRNHNDCGGFWVDTSSWDDTCPDGSEPKTCAQGDSGTTWWNSACIECVYLKSCRPDSMCKSECPKCLPALGPGDVNAR